MNRRFTFFLTASICLIAAACDKAAFEDIENGSSVSQELVATLNGTRTSIDDDWNTSWSSGDALSVYFSRTGSSWGWYNNNYVGYSQFTYKIDNSFSGTTDSFDSPYNWFVVYPSTNSKSSTMQKATISIEHPQAQTQQGDSKSHISGKNDPLYGFSIGCQENPTIQMHHIASAIHFHVKNCTDKPIQVLSIQLTAPAAITGTFKSEDIDLHSTDYKGGAPSWTAQSGSSYNDVTLSVSDGVSFGKDQEEDFYAAIHPIKAKGNYTIKVRARSEGKVYAIEKTVSSTLEFKEGKYADIRFSFTNPSEETFKVTVSADIENDKLKTYLDKVEADPYFSDEAVTTTFFEWNEKNYGSSHMRDLHNGNNANNRFDHPKPVTISWVGDATDVDIFSDETRTDEVPNEVKVSTGKAEVYNLIPGKKYWFTIKDGSSTVYEGSFTPTGRRRMMKVSTTFNKSNAANCRDFGGLKTVAGGSLRYGLIYRGTNLDNFKNDPGMREVLINVMGIKLDVDLRNSGQARGAQDLTGYGISSDYQDYTYENLNDLTNTKKISTTLSKIMKSVLKDEPVYIHCSIGSDRTGYVSALIEALLGVTQNWTDTDYELTSFCSSITDGARLRTDQKSKTNCKYKDELGFIKDFNGATFSAKVYDYVVTSTKSNALKMDKSTVDAFIAKMQQ